MKSVFIVLCVVYSVFNPSNIYAQSSISGKISDDTGLPVEFANTSLLKASDSTVIFSTLTNEFGEYRFLKVNQGEYILSSFVLGQEKSFSQKIMVDGQSKIIQHLSLKNTTIQTEEVVVTSKKPLIRFEDGKMIVNVENTLGNSGQTAIEVLRKSPGIFIDQDGKIQLKGKSGVQVMLDDKSMYLNESQLANLLKSIPSDQIKEIEIVTAPSAKYDAVGNGGIINIKLKKGAYEGLNGAANATYGRGVYHKSNVGVNVSYKKNKVDFNTSYQYKNDESLSDLFNDRINSDQTAPLKRIYNTSYYWMPNNNNNFSLKGDYKISDKTSFSYDFNNNYGQWYWYGDTDSKAYKQDNSIKNHYVSEDNGVNKWLTLYSSLGFKHKFDTLGTELSGYGAYNHSTGMETKLQTIQNFDSVGVNDNMPFIFSNSNKWRTDLINGQIDFSKKLNKKSKMELGVKAIQNKEFSPNNIFITEASIKTDRSNYFEYNENIYAGYAMTSYNLEKWSFQGGVRLERTIIKGVMSLIDSTFNRDYTNLFPSATINYNQSDKTSYTIQYSRRITRPNGDQLNPVLNIIDRFSAWGGDPYLLAQYADNTEFTHSIFGGGLITTLNYTYISNPIVWANKLNKKDDKFVSGPRNLEFQKSYGISISINVPIKKWWNSNNNILLNNNQFVGNTDFGRMDNQMNSWGVKSTQSFTLPKDFSIEIFGMYDSPSSYAYAYANQRWQTNFAIQKNLWDKKASVKIAYNDMFWKYQYGGINTAGTTTQTSNYRWDNRTLLLTFTYRFGNKLLIRQ